MVRPLAVAVFLAALLGLPAIAEAVLAGPNGRVVFVSGRDGGDGQAKIYLRTIVGGAGGGTSGEPIAASTGQHRHPTWSPDRTQIAYARGDASCATDCDIYVLDITTPGAVPQNITNTPTITEDRPAWSPDGTRIAYESEVTAGSGINDLIVHTVDGGAKQNLTNTPAAHEGKPAWTPDSVTIFFHRGNLGVAGEGDIVRIPAGGGTPVNVAAAPGISEFQPSISPDGTEMCFTRDGNFANVNATQIVVSLINGGGQTLLNVNDPAVADYNCTWSPDGTKIAWVQGAFTGGDLVMANADNSSVGLILLEARVGAFDGNPDWAPDGQPACEPVTVSTLFNMPVSVPLVCNDTGPEYERAGITENLPAAPANGTLGPIQQGAPTTEPSRVLYTPNLGFSGTDTFEFNGFGGGFATRVPATINVGQGPDQPPDTDTTPPELTLNAKSPQKLGKAIKLSALCDEACAVIATGKLKLKNPTLDPAKQSFKLRPATVNLVANQNGQLNLKVPKRAQRLGAQALEDGGKVKAKLSADATDAAGNRATAKRAVQLKAKKNP